MSDHVMIGADGWRAMVPLLLLSTGCVLLMLQIAWRRSNTASAWLTAIVLLVCLLLLPRGRPGGLQVTPMLLFDGYFTFTAILVLLSALSVVLFAQGYLQRLRSGPSDEFYLLLLVATLGGVVMLASDHFVSFFLGLETLSVALLGLIAYPRHRPLATEAAMKYLVLAGSSSAFLLFGIALLYALSGSLGFAPAAGAAGLPHQALYRLAGLALVITGIGFKLSVVPFHMWAPDVYEGAPAPAAAFVAVVSKLSVFTVLVRYFLAQPGNDSHATHMAVALFALLSMLVGNVLALAQDNLKRLLAYSSIAHLGYLLVAFLAAGRFGLQASSYYLAAYAVTTLGAFGALTLLSDAAEGADEGALAAWRGLFWRRPALAAALSLMLLSLAGIPPTMGFIAKAYVLVAGVDRLLSLEVAALVIGSVIGLYYYLRVIVVLLTPAEAAEAAEAEAEAPAAPPPAVARPLSGALALALLCAALVGLGAWPQALLPAVGTALPAASAVRDVPHAGLSPDRFAPARLAPARLAQARAPAPAGPQAGIRP